MSWQAYVDDQICGAANCRLAVIAGLQDGGIWGKHECDLLQPVSQQELKAIADLITAKKFDVFQSSGLHLAGEKYFCVYAEPVQGGTGQGSIVRGRKGSCPLSIASTNTCLIVAAAVDGFPAGALNVVVEKLADYLRSNNY